MIVTGRIFPWRTSRQSSRGGRPVVNIPQRPKPNHPWGYGQKKKTSLVNDNPRLDDDFGEFDAGVTEISFGDTRPLELDKLRVDDTTVPETKGSLSGVMVPCDQCGKQFYRTPQYAYKIRGGKSFCSWSCLRTYEKAHEKKKKKEAY